MTGRLGYRTMELNGGSSALYLACTPSDPLFCTFFPRGGKRRAFRLPGAGIISIVRWNLRPVIFGVELALKSYFFTSIWGAHKTGCDIDTFVLFFVSRVWVSWEPQTQQNKGKRKMRNRPCLPATLGLLFRGFQKLYSPKRCSSWEYLYVYGIVVFKLSLCDPWRPKSLLAKNAFRTVQRRVSATLKSRVWGRRGMQN